MASARLAELCYNFKMSEEKDSSSDGKGLLGFGKQVITSLAPSSLMLIMVLGGVLWYEHSQTELRAQLIRQLIDVCIFHRAEEHTQPP
jgi:hypothetical protein